MTRPPIHEIQTIYDRAYAEPGLMGTHFDQDYSKVTKTTLLSYCEDAPNERVLDLGTGDGDLWQFVDRGLQRHGIDVSVVGVRSSLARFPGVHAVVGIAEHLPYPDSYFGAIVAADTLEHTLDLPASLTEIRRVLAPNGVLAFSVPAPDSLRKWGLNTFVRQRPDPIKALRLGALVLKCTWMFGRADFQPIDMDLSLEEWSGVLEETGFQIRERVAWPVDPLEPIVYLMAAQPEGR